MERCQDDTLEVLGSGAAGRLGNWQRYEDDLEALVNFIRERLLHTRENGYALEQKHRLSLERIVVHECPELFSVEDRQIAEATLAGILQARATGTCRRSTTF